MEITLNNWERFFDLRRKIFKAIDKVDDGYHKSYEGAMDVRFIFNNYFESKNIDDLECVEIELHCYLLVNGRHITWTGKTFEEALTKAEEWFDNI